MSRDDERSAPQPQSTPDLVTARPDAQLSPVFERFTRLASRLVDAPIAMLGVAQGDQIQLLATLGTSELIHPNLSLPSSQCLCQNVIDRQQPLAIPDTDTSALAQNCWIVARTGTRAFLGVPIGVSGGETDGCLMVAAVAPREWSDRDITSLEDLAILIADEMQRHQPEDSVAEAAFRLQQSQTGKERLLEAIGEGVYAVDISGYCQFINRAGANILGYEPEQLLGKRMHELVHHSYPDGTPMPRSECTVVQATLAGDALTLSEHVFWRRDGSPVHVELTVSPVADGGEVTGTVVRFSDVSERQRQQELLRESEVRKSAMFEAALDCIITIDHVGRVIEFNAAAERTFGYSREYAIGRMMTELIMPAAFHQPCLDAFQDHLETGESSILGARIERPAMRADGTIIETEMTITRIDLPDQPNPIFTAYLRDITHRNAAEREIRRYKHMVDSVGQAVIANDNSPERLITYWNKAAEQILGWPAEDVIGKGFYDIVPAPDFHRDVEEIGVGVRQGHNWHGEFQMRHRDGHVIPALASVSPILNEDGELLGVVSAYTDISELKKTEREIRLYKHLTDAVGQALVGNSLDRRITYWNRAAEEMLGWTAEEVIGRKFNEIVPSGDWLDRVRDIGDLVREGESWSGEFMLRRKSGEMFPVLISVGPVLDDDGNVIQVIGAYTDISELKKTEREIRLYKHLTDAVGQALIGNSLDRRITYWNRAAEEMLGWTAEEVIGRDFYEIVPADDWLDRISDVSQRVRQGQTWSGEFRLKRKSGETFPVIMSVSPVLDDEGNVLQIIGAYTDISELKETERQIRFHKHLSDATGQALVSTDLKRHVTYWNHAAELMLGWQEHEVLGRDFADIAVHDDNLARVPPISAQVRQGVPWSGEFLLKHRDGRPVPALMSINPVLDDEGTVVQVIGAYTDITTLRQREDDIRFFKHIVEAIGEAVVSTDMGGVIRYMNSAAEDMLGWSADELIGLPVQDVLPNPDFLDRARKIAAYVRTGKTFSGEFELLRKDGSTFPALFSLAPVINESGEPTGVISVYNDITDLKQALEENRFFKHIVDAVGQAVVVSDTAGNISYWNRAAEDIYGWTPDEAIGELVYDLLSPEPVREQSRDVTRRVASGQTWSGEVQVRRRDGTEFPAYFTVAPIRNAEDEIVGIIGVSHDISDQKDYERQIEFHKIMLDAVGQTIVTTDTDRNITFWSKGAENALGWSADEVLGRPIAEFAPAAHLKEEAGELHRKVKSGETWTGEFPIQRKDGSQSPAVVTLAPVQLADQGTVGVIGVYTDITELKETEDELRFHKHMLDAVGQAVFATDEALRITYWNQAAEVQYGYTPAEATGVHVLDFFPSGSTGITQAVNAIEIVSREGSWTGEVTTYHRDGREISTLVNISPILGEDDRQVGLIVALADITARRAVEQALQESNEQITEILESMGDGFASVARDWTITYVNRELENIASTSREHLIGKNFWEMFPDPPHQPFYQKFAEAFETGKGVHVSDYDEQLGMWLEVYATPSRDELSVFVHDVTERREREIALREAEERYRTLIEQLPAMTYISRADDLSDITYVSPQVETMFGYTQEQWTREEGFWERLLHPEDRERVIREDRRTHDLNRDRFTLEYRLRAADGSYRWLRDSATLIRDIDGNPGYWQGLSYDITDEKRSERIVRESEQRFRSLFDNHPDAVFSIDSTGHVLSANPKFEELSGVSSRKSGVVTFVDLVVPEDQKRAARLFAKTHQGMPQDFRAGMVDPHGKRLELSLTTIPISVDDEIVGVHVVAQDITVHQELENQLAHQAYHDALTGLPNRNLFQNRLDERLEQSRQDQSRFAVLFFDLDDFKVINDSLGHSAGDQLLVEVAGRVQTCIRSNDLLARLGGDEFTLLLEGIDDERDAVMIAERVAAVLDEPFDIEDHEVFATASIGIAVGDSSAAGSDDILRNADLAMYEAKNSGRNRYAIFEPSMNSRAWLRLTLEAEIRRGIPRDEFVVYYQPIIDLETGELDGVEALVRWNHPERGFLTPGDFISVAEQSGLILPLGRWIIRESTTQLRNWQYLMPAGRKLRLSLNLSPKQYQHPRLIEELTRSLATVNFDPTLITLEITESIAMDDSPETIQTLQELKDVGVQLALDDFGTGFSALSYLRRFPIDIIKIDQSFVAGLGLDEEDTSIVRAVMAASLAMKLSVTAEGIETHEQLGMLRELGCQYGQGYLFAHALTADEMHRIIEAGDLSWGSLISHRP